MTHLDLDIHRLAADAFGLESLRPAQVEALRAIAHGRDAVAVLPTGAGKSAIFQVGGRLLGGLTVVISPLLALQRDQVAALHLHPAAGRAEVLNSTLTSEQRQELLACVRDGGLSFLYLSPEQLLRPDLLNALRAAPPTLVAVDEAHCLSQWGHDFRPAYLRIASAVQDMGGPPVCACTATASPPVLAEIVERLRMRDPVVVTRGFDRPEIHLEVSAAHDTAQAKRTYLLEQAAGLPKPLIVYVATRADTADLSEELASIGLDSRGYHGALPTRSRERIERAWLAGEIDVLVATNAFGLGVDKPDIRTVIHADPPESLDAYLQEVGRAARDGHPGQALLCWRPEDLGVRKFFAGGLPKRGGLVKAFAITAAAGRAVTEAEFCSELGWTSARTARTLDLLVQAGALHVAGTADGAEGIESSPGLGPDAAAGAALEVARNRKTVERSRLDMVRAFAETQRCRRQLLLASFGEILDKPCGNCDRCDAGIPESDVIDQAQSPFPIGSIVCHAQWGSGLVMRYEVDRIVVLFQTQGYRTLDLDAVTANHLLETDEVLS